MRDEKPRQGRGLGFYGALVLVGCLAGCPGYGEAEGVNRDHEARRLAMVEGQIRSRGVSDPAVLRALEKIPRHLFVGSEFAAEAYDDRPLPIGFNQTISQPYIVALMTELLGLEEDSRVLEIGTGSGYQAAVLAEIVSEVYSIEIVEPLAERSTALLARLGYENVEVRAGDGYAGWPEQAPFDAVVLTAAPPVIPQPLLEQLAPGGRLVAPVGDFNQDLVLITRSVDGFDRREILPVRFVPMTGVAQRVRKPVR